MRGGIRKACLHPLGSRTEDPWDGTHEPSERQEGGAYVEIRAELTNHRGRSLQGGNTGRAQGKDIQMVTAAASKFRITGLWAGKKCELCLKNSAWLLCVEWRARGAEGRLPVKRLSRWSRWDKRVARTVQMVEEVALLVWPLYSSPALPCHQLSDIVSFILLLCLKARFEKTGRLKKVFKIKNNKNYFLSALRWPDISHCFIHSVYKERSGIEHILLGTAASTLFLSGSRNISDDSENSFIISFLFLRTTQ